VMLEFTIPVVIGLAIGFILGYGVRAIISRRRHQRARRQSFD
jgi:NhaP-type Na+/H+ or K+/H+ antiporter